MKGKTCIITGATSGIGLETAVRFGPLGAQLVLVGGSREKGEAALARLRTRAPAVTVEMHYADLSRADEISGSRALCLNRPSGSTSCSTTRAHSLRVETPLLTGSCRHLDR